MAAEAPTPEALRAEGRDLLRLLNDRWDDIPPDLTDAVTQVLLTVLGSGPAFATLQGMLTAEQANALMYHNAVAHQQKTNLLGMAMTAKCVRYMLDPNAPPDFDAWAHEQD